MFLLKNMKNRDDRSGLVMINDVDLVFIYITILSYTKFVFMVASK